METIAIDKTKTETETETNKYLLQYTITVQIPVEAEDDEAAYDEAYDTDPLDYINDVRNTDIEFERAVELTEDEWAWWTRKRKKSSAK
tara:strand:- start:1004 stop:1267 length:264 start_codon:yes stop_codon:yes gene_type:complete